MPGAPELAFIVFLVLILFGPDKIPDLARQAGKIMRELRRASNDLKRQLNLDDD